MTRSIFPPSITVGLVLAFVAPQRTWGQTILIAPSALTFTMAADSTTPPPSQTVQVTSPSGSVPFSLYTYQSSFFNGPPFDPVFVSVSPSSGVTPATVTVSLLPVALAWGYGGYYNLIGSGVGPTVVKVLLDIALPPPPAVASVLNGATFQPAISPGAVVSIFGDHIGPGIPAYGFASGVFGYPGLYYPDFVDDSKVTFDGYLAPILYAGSTQINAVVPYEVAGRAGAQVVVTHDFVAAPAIAVPLIDTSPGIFTVAGNGAGQGAILNQNGTLNGAQNAAPAGSIIQIFATGAGLWNPAAVDGQEAYGAPPWAVPVATVAVSIGGLPAQITYAGAAPDLIIGVLQVNAVIPAGLTPGPQAVVLTVGTNSNAQQRVTVAVQ